MSSQRFEYLVHQVRNNFFKMQPDADKLGEELNRLGGQGWELVTRLDAVGKFAAGTTLIFKRER